jgi:glycosyltransferase involved in cell wall biosynthesis
MLQAAWQLLRFLSRERIDVLQTYFPESTYLGVPMARLAGVPYVLRTRNNLGHWLTPHHRRLGRLMNRLVSGTVANCHACRQAMLAEERLPKHSIVVLENGVDLDQYERAAHEAWPHEKQTPWRVGAVANLRPVKGLDVLVDAAALVQKVVPGTEFVVAGEGAMRPDLENQARTLGLGDRFQLPGHVGDIPAFLTGIDIAVLCSRSEGMSNALLEYMAAGRAIVATAVGAAKQLIENGRHGLLVPVGNAERLANALVSLIQNPAYAMELGRAARRRVEERHGRAAMVRNFENFYDRLVRR